MDLTSQYGGFKPQIFVFEKMLEELKAKPSECIMIGDCYNDIGATQVGIFSVLIGNNYTKEFVPNLKIKNFQELMNIIDFDKCMLKPLQLMEEN
ncbi:MAG: HAD hydrolase-like protein [bacterium]|nr:HAD hydrolase-like protein [bacterium]